MKLRPETIERVRLLGLAAKLSAECIGPDNVGQIAGYLLNKWRDTNAIYVYDVHGAYTLTRHLIDQDYKQILFYFLETNVMYRSYR